MSTISFSVQLLYFCSCIITLWIQILQAVPDGNCQCTCESIKVNEISLNPTQDEDYTPRWFKKNCSQLSTEAAITNLFRSLEYLKQITTDILSQTSIEYETTLKRSCLPSSTLNVTQFDRHQIYQRILQDTSRMATFVNRLKMNNQPDSSPNRSRQSAEKLFDDDREYYVIDHILQLSQCYLRNIISDSNFVSNVHNLARVEWDQCHWGCKDDRCLFREIVIINRLKLIASSSLQLMNVVETINV